MRCGEVRQRLDLYATKELTQVVREKIEAHLESCEECREALVRVRRFEELLTAAPAPPVPDGFAVRVVARANERQAHSAGQLPSLRARPGLAWKRIRFSAATAAALATGLMIGVFMGHETWRADRQQTLASAPRSADPLAASGFEYLVESGGDSLAQAYLGLTATSDR